ISTQALAEANEIGLLQRAGARYIIVPNLQESSQGAGLPINAVEQEYKHVFNTTLYGQLVADGVNFIPADFDAVHQAVLKDFKINNPLGQRSSFGFDFIGTLNVACPQPASGPFQDGGFSLLCTDPKANADKFFLADFVHLSSAAERIFADYDYSLVLAPSQV